MTATARRDWRTILHAVTLAIAVAGYPLIAGISSLLTLDNTTMSIGLRAIVGAAALAMLLSYRHGGDRDSLPHWGLILVVFFWILYLARISYETTYYGSYLFVSPTNYWIWAMGGSFIPMLGLSRVICGDAEGVNHAFWVRMIILLAIIVVLPIASTTVDVDTGTTDTGRLGLQTLNPISMGHLGVSAIIIALWSVFLHSKPLNPRIILVSGIMLLIGAILAISANSRGPLAALLAAIIFMILASRIRRKYWLVAILGAAVVGFGPLVLSVDSYFGTRTFERLFGQSQFDDVTTLVRVNIFDSAIDQFLRNPVFGDGLEVRDVGGYPHNLILEAFMTTGIVGGVAFVLMLALAISWAWRVVRYVPAFGWLGLIFIQYFVATQFSGSLFESTTFWGILGALFAVSIRNHDISGGNFHTLNVRTSPLRNLSLSHQK